MTIPKSKKIVFITPKETKFVRGGIASWTTKLSQNGLPKDYSFKIIDSSVIFKRGIFNLTKYNILFEFIRTTSIICKLFFQIMIFQPKNLHINSSISEYGVLRDLICLIISRIFGLKVFVHFRGNLPQVWQSKRPLLNKVLDKLIILSNGVIAINNPSLSYLKQRVEVNKIHKVESFIEENAFAAPLKNSNRIEDCQILFIGAFIEEKGAEEIIALAKHFSKQIFHVVGQISEKHKKIISQQRNIIMQGILSRNEIFDLLNESDIFLFPSHTEGFPNVILEAMSRGLPVIASNVGAIPEMIIEGKGGYLSKVNDMENFIYSLARLINNPKERKKMGNYNYQLAKRLFTYDVIIKKLLKIYQA